MDSSALLAALDTMEENDMIFPIHSLLVIRHGYIVLDASIYPHNAALPHAMYSVTKSFVSTVWGSRLTGAP